MKQLFQLSLISSLALSPSVFALNPVQGFYGGLMAEASHGPTTHIIEFTHDNLLFTGTVNYNQIGGGGGLVLGYRIQNYRIEGEFLYNRVSYDSLKIGACTLQSPSVTTPTGICPQDNFQSSGLGFNGSTAVAYGMINGYYDFVSYGSENYVVPYLGFGLGESRVKNSSNFVNTSNLNSRGYSETFNSPAAQVILGVSFYMDDYTWAGMDYRYLTTNTIKNFANTRYGISTLNFNVNFAFGKG